MKASLKVKKKAAGCKAENEKGKGEEIAIRKKLSKNKNEVDLKEPTDTSRKNLWIETCKCRL